MTTNPPIVSTLIEKLEAASNKYGEMTPAKAMEVFTEHFAEQPHIGMQIAEEYYRIEPLTKARLAQLIDTAVAGVCIQNTGVKDYLVGVASQGEPNAQFDSVAPASNQMSDEYRRGYYDALDAASQRDNAIIESFNMADASTREAAEGSLRTPKPVSISLEKCAKAIPAASRNGYADFRYVAKAVLDSAKQQGVEMVYVD